MMANGTGRLWDDDCVQMLPLRKYVQEKWLKIATNSQLVERWVKDSNECTATSKDEKMANIYAIIRSCTVMYFNDDCRREHKDRIRKATKFFTRGKLGERTDKRTGLVENVNENKRDEMRGSMLVETIIKGTIQLRNEVLALNISEDVRKRIHSHLISDNKQFDTFIQTNTTGALEAILNQPHKPPNTIQKMTGIDTTPHAKREIKYTKCLTKHINLIQAELQFRGIQFDEKAKVMELKRILKKDSMDRQTAHILETTNVPARPVELDTTYFKPIHRPAEEWGSAYHIE